MITARHLLVIDAGTTGGRVSLFTADGDMVVQVRWPLEHHISPEAAPWGRELDTDAVWRAVTNAVREALACAEVPPRTVLAVAVTSQRQGIALLDESGRTLYAGPNIDLRGVFQGTRLQKEHSEFIYAITGHLPPHLFAPARLLWFRDHQPQRYARISTLLMLDGWLAWLLSGSRVAEVASAAESGLFNVTKRTWSVEMIEALELPTDIYPTLLPAGAISGHLSERAAALTGLEAGTPVMTAGPDTQCGLLGMGITGPGERGIVAGWSAPAQQVVARPIFDPQRQLWTTCHLLPDTWVIEANAGPAGQAHLWLRDLLVPGQSFEELDQLAIQASLEGGELQDVPVLAFLGPRLADYGDPRLLWGGLVFPLVGSVDGLGQVKQTHVARAGLENIAFALRANLELARALAGPGGDVIRLGGGLTRSRVFLQIMADVLGTPVWVSNQPDVTSLGACLCAAVGIGIYADLQEAAALVRSWGQTLEPQRIAQAHYIDAYERWRIVYDQLEQLSEMID